MRYVPANAFCPAAPEPSACNPVMATPQMPIGSDVTPMSVPESSQNALTVNCAANTSIFSPEPPVFAMQLVAVMVFPVDFPISSFRNPTRSIPTVVDAMTIQVISDSAVAAPPLSAFLVVVITPPQVPIGPDSPPMALVITVQGAVAITVHPNPPVTTPHPLVSTMEMVVEMILAPQVPVGSNTNPPPAIPTSQDPQTVQVAANSAILAPPPARSPAVMISPVEFPLRPNPSPASLVIPHQSS